MINLSSEPSLGSMVITRDGVWKYSYILPRGMTFPEDSTGRVVVTDRAGATLAEFDGTPGDDSDRINFLVDAADLEEVPAGSNWELFVTFDEGDGEHTYKVRYGRVVRREVTYPLNPITSEFDPYQAVQYEDTLQRSTLGPRWSAKYGRANIFANPGQRYGMSVNSVLFADAAVLWYAPVRSDTVSVTVGLRNPGAGKTTLVLCSNSSMTSYMGVMWETGIFNNYLRIVTGTGPITMAYQGSALAHSLAGGGATTYYTVKYSYAENKLSVYKGNDLTPIKEWEDVDNIVPHGLGRRYVGFNWQSSLLSTGVQATYFKAKDDV